MEAWEAKAIEGWHEGYKVDVRENTSKIGVGYSLVIFRVELPDGTTGRYAWYCGHHRAEELKRVKYELAINPYAEVLVKKKPGIAGYVIEEVKTRPPSLAPQGSSEVR